MRVENHSRKTILAESCIVANTFTSRFLGLMGKRKLPPGNGLLIKPCNSIHMFFMRFPLDIVFLDKQNIVVHIIEGIKPWHVSPIVSKACCVLELPEGAVSSSSTSLGDCIEFIS